jgi:hypothetical protein
MECILQFLVCKLYVALTVSLGKQRQWWEFKAQHMDKVLFFKVHFYFCSSYLGTSMMTILFSNYTMNLKQMGKFYELFEMDAHVGAKELDLQYMKARTFPKAYLYSFCYYHLVILATFSCITKRSLLFFNHVF